MSEDIKISEFNELQFKMIRIHKIQDQINELWNNPLIMNHFFGNYNYESLLSNIQRLYSECYAKTTEHERKEYKKLIEEIEKLIEDKPPFEKSQHPLGKRLSFNKNNWKELNKKLTALDLYVRELLDKHGFSPDKDDGLGGL